MQQSLGHWLSNTRQKHHWMLCSILQYSSRLQQFATFLSWGFMMNCLSQFNNYLANFYCAESMPHFSQVTFPFPLNEETSLSLMLPLQWTEWMPPWDFLLHFKWSWSLLLFPTLLSTLLSIHLFPNQGGKVHLSFEILPTCLSILSDPSKCSKTHKL